VTADMLRRGAHINAVGAYRPDMRELAGDVIRHSTVVVDEIGAAHDEAGDPILAADEGWSWDRVAGDLADICSGRVERRSGAEITLFKSVGLAFEDLVIARLVAQATNLL
jgi:ornithine cyclodeaminase